MMRTPMHPHTVARLSWQSEAVPQSLPSSSPPAHHMKKKPGL